MGLHDLVEIDGLESIDLGVSLPAYIHTDHRFCLPMLFKHQKEGDLPKPCNLILFDRHHDLLSPDSLIDILKSMRANGFSEGELLTLCKDRLRVLDDDWIIAGMELGLIKDVVIFGVDGWYDDHKHEDHTGYEHRIEVECCVPGQLLGYQGSLSDVAKRDELTNLWDILQWELVPKEGFQFNNMRDKVWLNIDLDCFIISWKNYLFPWFDEVFSDHFFATSDYWSTNGWTGKSFFVELMKGAGLLTIAREPDHCGGQEKMEQVFDKVNQYLFDHALKIIPYSE